MVVYVVFKLLQGGEPALNQFSPYHFIEPILFDDRLVGPSLTSLLIEANSSYLC